MIFWLVTSLVVMALLTRFASVRQVLSALGAASVVWVLIAGMAGTEMLWAQLRGIGWPAAAVLAAAGVGFWLQFQGIGYSHPTLAHAMVTPGGENRPAALRLVALSIGLVEAVFVSMIALQVFVLLQAELPAAGLYAVGICVGIAVLLAARADHGIVQSALAGICLVLATGWLILWAPAAGLQNLGRPAATLAVSPWQVLGFAIPFAVFWAGSPALLRVRHLAGKPFHQGQPFVPLILLASSVWVGLQVYTLDLVSELPLLPQVVAQVFHGSLHGLARSLVLLVLVVQLCIFWLSQTQLYAVVLGGPSAGWQWQVAAAPVAVLVSAGIPLMLGGLPGWLTLAAGAWLSCVFWPWLLLRPARGLGWFLGGVFSSGLVFTAAIVQASPGDPGAWAAAWVGIVWCGRTCWHKIVSVKDRTL